MFLSPATVNCLNFELIPDPVRPHMDYKFMLSDCRKKKDRGKNYKTSVYKVLMKLKCMFIQHYINLMTQDSHE